MKFLASIVKQHPSIAMKCCTLPTPGASVWAAVFSWQGGRVQGPHTEMCRSSVCLHHRGRYPSLYLNTVFPPVTSTLQHSTLPQMSTSLPVTQLLGRHLGSLLLIMHWRTSVLTWLILSTMVFHNRLPLHLLFFQAALISYVTEIGGKVCL